jgi:gluconolactonase
MTTPSTEIQGGETILAPGAALHQIQTGFAFTEGPSSDRHGNVYFTDQPNDRIMRWDAKTGNITLFLQPCGRSNGTTFDEHGSLWTCADELNALWKIDVPSGKHEVVVANYQGHLLNGPNDVWINPKTEGIYLTDPLYVRDYWTSRSPESQMPLRGVLYLTPDHKNLSIVASDLTQPNGIIGTPDGKTLYVSDINAKQTWAYDINPDGTLTDKRLFNSMGSDGMTIDSGGNVYLTNHGVTVFDPKGNQICHIPVNEGWTGNVCFGGTDMKTLFITASTSVYSIAMKVHGVGSQ